jgi:CRISPR-associated protein Csb2
MPSRTLLITVRLLNGRYHGVGDWPPAPFRLFQALVAGAYGGRWAAETANLQQRKDEAFGWLERLDPPHIAAPAKLVGGTTKYYVPNNDLRFFADDAAKKWPLRGSLRRPAG